MLPAVALAQAGQNITGQVMNASIGKPLAHAAVTLVQLQGAMQPVATTTTDDTGHYRFSQNAAGPFMVEADFQKVPYFAQVTAGQSETNLMVFNVNDDASKVGVDAEIMVLQPDAGQLAVVNEYRIENGLTPPATLARPGGIFRFRVPPGAHVDMVRVVGPNEMPLSRNATPTSQHDVYGVDSPLRPGETRIQVSYRVPYAGLKAALSETPVEKPAHFEVYVPGPMTFQGAGFTQVGAQDGYNVYGVANTPVATTLTFTVAGDAPMPAPPSNAGAAPGAAGAGQTSSAAAPAAAPAEAVPTPTLLERNRWIILALLLLAAAAGFGILLARPEEAAAAAGAATASVPASAPASEMSRLKDDLFLLEVQRHTGRIADSEYDQQRAALNRRLDQLAGR
ncbi:MAG TPA: carboxypeptidase-like regulatory domain-containing protein [Terriglobales bacterium]